jgi:hypothetical protein
MADIFISYAREDIDKVKALAEELEARCVISVWSQHSVKSDWVRLEASEGLKRNILVSVAIEPDLKLPLRFRYIHTDPLIEWEGNEYYPALEKIVGDLTEILDHPETTRKDSFLDAMVEVPARSSNSGN